MLHHMRYYVISKIPTVKTEMTNKDFEKLIAGLIVFRNSDLWLYENNKNGKEVIKAQRPKHATTAALSIILKEYRKNPDYFKELSYKKIIDIAYNTAIRTSRYAPTMEELRKISILENQYSSDLQPRIELIKSQFIH